jgi:hypothetical protein
MKARIFTRPLLLAVVPFALHAAAAFAADTPPDFNVEPSCRAAATAAHNQKRLQGCLDSERRARDQLVKEWTDFTAATRSQCLKAASVGGEATYTELLTCLEMTRDVKKNPNDISMRITSPDGNGPKTAIERARGH